MRVIKFRAWHKKYKKMYSVLHLHIETDIWATAKGRNPIEHKDIHIRIQPKDAVVMQFIGLQDRNGKEIYEGDVVHYKELIPSLNELQRMIQGADFVYLEFNGVIVWDDEGASFDIDGGNHGYRGFGTRGNVEIEVIGNIYEHPHLLKEETTP
jgi:uncharacterized phage protein (TIGR01671 family)